MSGAVQFLTARLRYNNIVGYRTMDIEKKLLDHGVRPTAVRIMLLAALTKRHGTVSAQELEIELDTVDRSTISRSLATFMEAGLLHVIDDGTGVPKYECCPSEHSHHAADSHAHFHCLRCGATLCLESMHIDLPKLPEGFQISDISYIISGLCPKCSLSQ